MEEEDIQQAFSKKVIYDVASDGSHKQLTGALSYGWVVAINNTVIAKGQGPAAVHPQLAGSFRAEGYGLASAAAFLQTLLQYFNINPKHHDWYFYLDNKSLISKIEKYQSEKELPKWNLLPDADIIKTSHRLLENIPATFIHVKGHQDSDKPPEKLSLPAQLNILADALATDYRNKFNSPIYEPTNPFCYLKIRDKYITKDSKQWIMDEASKIPIHQYYHDKFKWSRDTFESINWTIQRKTLILNDDNDQRRILKMVHGWLPTYDRLHRELQSTTSRCPLCHYLVESNLHLFVCQHKEQQDTFQKVFQFLDKDSSGTGNKVLNSIIKSALLESPTNDSWKPEQTNNEELNRCLKDQS
jgi:hypothetical protein